MMHKRSDFSTKFFNFITGSKLICSLSIIFSFLILPYSAALEIKAQTSVTFEELVDSAELYSSLKKWNKAEEMTIKALQLKPANKMNWLLWSNLAEIREKLDDIDGALTAYNIGLSLQPSSPKMRMGRAAVLMEVGRSEEAIADLSELIALDSIAEWPRMIRGMAHLGLGELNKAEEDFMVLKGINPENPQSYNGLAKIRAKQGKIKEAITLFSESLRINKDVDIYFYKISLQADNGMLPEASETLREAMKNFPRNGNLFLLRAYLHKLNFQQEEAEIALKLAKEYGADPQLIEVIFPKSGTGK